MFVTCLTATHSFLNHSHSPSSVMANKKACSWLRWMPEWILFGMEHNFTRWSPSRTPAVGKYGLLLQTLFTRELADSRGPCCCYVWSNSRTMEFQGQAINMSMGEMVDCRRSQSTSSVLLTEITPVTKSFNIWILGMLSVWKEPGERERVVLPVCV